MKKFLFFDLIKKDMMANDLKPVVFMLPFYIILYPSFSAVFNYRLQRVLRKKGRFGSAVARFLRSSAIKGGVDINPRAVIGPGLALPHPIGVIIGGGVIIGERCTLYQNTTLGAMHRGGVEYPNIGNDVIIYTGAVVVGNVFIEDKGIVKANKILCV